VEVSELLYADEKKLWSTEKKIPYIQITLSPEDLLKFGSGFRPAVYMTNGQQVFDVKENGKSTGKKAIFVVLFPKLP